ncbi:MAG TPA: hypothetical protein VFZ58_01510 [Candidatus Saccharimonadales bacterium]
MDAVKRLYARYFTQEGRCSRSIVEDVISRYDAPRRPLRAGQSLSGKIEHSHGSDGSFSEIRYRLFTHYCMLPGYHHCISVNVMLEGESTSIATLLFDAATGTHLKTLWP